MSPPTISSNAIVSSGVFAAPGSVAADDASALWISQGRPHEPALHLAFAAADRAGVDAFHKAALDAGGRDNGAPGIRDNYGPNYYAAFVLDPDGNNIEAVCQR